MSRKSKINNFENEILQINKKKKKKENSYEIKETEHYQIDSIKENEDPATNKNSKKDEDEENAPLIIKKKLIKIFNNINENLENNEDKKIEEIYDNYHKKKNNKKTIKNNLSKCSIYIMFYFVAVIFLIINLMAIFTSKKILESLYEIFVKSIQYFLYKKSDLELYELTDFENRFNSSYNFYKQYYTDISNNEVDFDLMMFWEFVGSLVYEYCDFIGTSILFFLLNVILLILIGGFNFLDIDEKNHKYSFFQILYISLVYLFLWISVSASALLSQQVYINSFQILKKKLVKEKKEKEELKEQKEEDHKEKTSNQEIENNIYQYNNINNNIKSNSSHDNTKTNDEGNNNFEYFYALYITSFFAYFINYPINVAITKYRKKYISKELENININREDAYLNIYSKDRKLFLFTVFIPYCGEIIISIIIYIIFDCIIFTKTKNFKNGNIKEKEIQVNNENNSDIKIKEISFKKIFGYTIFNQTIIEKEENLSFFGNICECLKLFFKSYGECFKNSFCFICIKGDCTSCYECNCCKNDCSICKCCKDCCSCCLEKPNFEQRDMEICICYQEKRKIKWFKDFINNKKQIILVNLVLLIAYFQTFTLGYEVLYKETNEKNESQENIMLPLIIAFLSYSFWSTILGAGIVKLFKNKTKYIGSFKFEIQEIHQDLSMSIVLGSIVSFSINGIYSFVTSILFFTNRKFFDKDKELHVSVYINKFAIFILTYFCQTQDEENELISNSSLIAVYLYIVELIFSLIKSIFSIKILIIFQIVFSAPCVLLYFSIFLLYCCLKYIKN